MPELERMIVSLRKSALRQEDSQMCSGAGQKSTKAAPFSSYNPYVITKFSVHSFPFPTLSYWFISMTQLQRGETERPTLWFTLQLVTKAKISPGQRQEPKNSSGFPHVGGKGPSIFLLLFKQH